MMRMKKKAMLVLGSGLLVAACSGDGSEKDKASSLGTESGATDDGSSRGASSGASEEGGTGAHGRGSSTDPTCGEKTITSTRAMVDMLVVLDRSYSMRGMLWDKMGEGLTQLTAAMGDAIDFGLILYPSMSCGDEGDAYYCAAPASSEVPYVALGDPDAAEAIAGVFELESQGGVGICGNTPTAETLQVAVSYLDGLPKGDKARAVLLATDGAPNCNFSLDGETCTCTESAVKCRNQGHDEYCLDSARAIDAASQVKEAGYALYVLGVGDNVGNPDFEATMNGMASAGGTASYYPVQDPEKIEAALRTIASAVASCEFAVDFGSLPESASRDKSKVNFYCKGSLAEDAAEGELIAFDPACEKSSGWDWTGDETARLCDGTCARLKRGECAAVAATFGCESKKIAVK